METTPLHPVVMKLNFPFITRKPSFNGRTLIEGRNTEMQTAPPPSSRRSLQTLKHLHISQKEKLSKLL